MKTIIEELEKQRGNEKALTILLQKQRNDHSAQLIIAALNEDPLTELRVTRAEILHHWQVESRSFDIEVELNNLVSQLGYRIKELPISYRPRLREKKLKISHGITILKRTLLKRLALNTRTRPNKQTNTPDSTANLLLS